MSSLLEVEDLTVDIGALRPVRGIGFTLEPGETLGIVGESGSGKSLTALALLRLLPDGARLNAARLAFRGQDLRGLSERRMADLRGGSIGMVFQDPMTSLNPSYTIGDQLAETVRRHRGSSRRAARDEAVAMLEKVEIAGAAARLAQYPHQLSGGLRQRVLIAMALICRPQLIIADEPTTALDVTVQAQILRLLQGLQREFGLALILITHDLGVVARMARRIAVMYAGEFVETGDVAEIFAAPAHPYTQALLRCLPGIDHGPTWRLGAIPGQVPEVTAMLRGCAFANRCRYASAPCREAAIALRPAAPGQSYRCVLAPEETRRHAREEAEA